MKHFLLLVSALLVTGAVSHAAVKPHNLFTDNAVLQRGIPLPVWGTANDGEKVTVTFAGQTVTTTAKDGKWMVKLEPLEANATPQTMTVTGSNTVEVKNLLVGEVWICSGQSNMEFPLAKEKAWKSGVLNSEQVIQAADDPQLRLFKVPRGSAGTPQSDVQGSWSECTSATVRSFSAVGYFFGRDLRKARKVPVGLISSSFGGTAAELWTSGEAMEAEASAPAKKNGKGKGTSSSSTLYNAMIAPLQPFAIAGVIWYQGESNSGRAKNYRTLFPTLIGGWRAKWGQGDFPFLFVQITPNSKMNPEIREAQLLTWQKTPKTAMVVTTDHGDANDIHPQAKEPVGARLALAARAIAYGEKIEYSGPVFESLKVEGSSAILQFTHLGQGLEAKGGELKGFTIAGVDKQFVAAKAHIEGDTLVVSSESVANPVAVRYGWANVPDVNLYNKDSLPATPFRSDVE